MAEGKQCPDRIEDMIRDLERGGWMRYVAGTWKSPSGRIYLGPHRAWHVWAGIPMEEV